MKFLLPLIFAAGCSAQLFPFPGPGTPIAAGGGGLAALVGTCHAATTTATNQAQIASVSNPGATLNTAAVAVYAASAPNACGGMMSDGSNNWHCIANYSMGGSPPIASALWYAYDSGAGAPLVTGPSITLTYTQAGSYPAMAQCAFSGTLTGADPLRTQAGATASSGSSGTGTITPLTGDLAISGFGTTGAGTYTLTAPFTFGARVSDAAGVNMGVGIGYDLVATTSLTTTWSAGGPASAATIAAFKLP
jgi:hypothetical protein